MNADELELAAVERAVAGDRVALNLLLTDSHVRLREHLLRRIPADLRSVLDAEDVLQESHVEVFRRIESFQPRGPGSFHRWTATIALSRLRNSIKRYRANKRGGGRRAVEPVAGSIEDSVVGLFNLVVAAAGGTPSRIVAKREAIGAVQTGLKDLPEQYRRAIWLMHIEGQSAKDEPSRWVVASDPSMNFAAAGSSCFRVSWDVPRASSARRNECPGRNLV